MTVWRISVEDRNGDPHDLIVEGDEEATLADFWDVLGSQGISRDGLAVGSSSPLDQTELDQSPLQNGMLIGRRRPAPLPGPGWYLVAIAGPDTGAWAVLGPSPVTVGRGPENGLAVSDALMSTRHFQVRLDTGRALIEDLGSTNGTAVEGRVVKAPIEIADGTYIHAGSTIFGLLRVEPQDLPSGAPKVGATRPFQQRFREALPPLPKSVKMPTEPTKHSDSTRRSLISFAIPIVTAVGMALITGRYVFLLIIMVGPIYYAVDGIRRRKTQEREEAEELEAYQRDFEKKKGELAYYRREELRRDRWAAAPAGLAALLSTIGHSRLWERTDTDADFCQVAIGLHNAPSEVGADGSPPGTALPYDRHWSAVLRHSLVRGGPLALRGALRRSRALGRALLADLAYSHSPNDLKLWLLTDGDAESEWNGVRWLPHTYMGDSQNRVFATPTARASAVAQLRSVINERKGNDNEYQAFLPVHVFVIDCLGLMDPDEVTDLLTEGAPVGVVGITLDHNSTPRGIAAELVLGQYADEAQFKSSTQPLTSGVRSCEMTAQRFEAQARAMAGRRPTGSQRGQLAETGIIRLVELIGAPTSPDGVGRIVNRWNESSPAPSVKVGGLRELEISIDIARDGPHGLVGGRTRSGKTEFLKAYFTSLAVANHPDDLSIVIVDFKGGVDHELSARLPHVIDLSTNHNVDSFVRTVELIEAEMKRRQELMLLAGKSGAPNFDAYHVARASDPKLPALPRLLVVIDEYSELLNTEQGKENMGALESVTRVGGGLGVHLLLVTQNFESQLPSQIAANAGLRICFQVQSPAHSKAVLESDEAAFIPKERIGRAFMRSHGGRPVEFQGARVAGPLPGLQGVSQKVRVRLVPFRGMADPPPAEQNIDVEAVNTDMWAVAEVLRAAATASGWSEPAVPWPKALPDELGLGEVLAARGSVGGWPVGLVDEPDRQRTTVLELAEFGPSMLLLGGAEAGLAEVVRAMVVSGAMNRGPNQFQGYVVDLLGQGLSSLGDLPNIGGVAERNESLALRIVNHVAMEASRRKAFLSQAGHSGVAELSDPYSQMSDLVLFINGADRLIGQTDNDINPLMWPITSLLNEAAGTGVRVVLAGGPRLANHRMGSSVGRRLVFNCADPQVYGTVGVPKRFHSMLDTPARAYDVNKGRLVQLGLVPSQTDASAGEVVRALGHRLWSKWDGPEDQLPEHLREVPWPLPLASVKADQPDSEIRQPVALAVRVDTGKLYWLDAEEDGPVFAVTGTGGRSSALLAAASLMIPQGWTVAAIAASRRSPLAGGSFPGQLIGPSQIADLGARSSKVALFIDDIHKWSDETDDLLAFARANNRCLIISGPIDFFRDRNDITRNLSTRSALILCPRGRRDGDTWGIGIDEAVLRDQRPGRGIMTVAGEQHIVQVPFADSALVPSQG